MNGTLKVPFCVQKEKGMVKIPQSVLDKQPVLPGLVLRGRGKVRDSYNLEDSSKMLVVASDRCSIFDLVLRTSIGFKGEILCALSYFWTNLLSSVFETDLIAVGSDFCQLRMLRTLSESS